MDEFEVQITIPPSEEHLDTITIVGPPARVDEAKKAVEQKVHQLDAEKEDRVGGCHGNVPECGCDVWFL